MSSGRRGFGRPQGRLGPGVLEPDRARRARPRSCGASAPRLRDAALLKVLAALAVAMLATLITNTKDGTGLNVIVPIEAVLVPLALARRRACHAALGRAGRARVHARAVALARPLAHHRDAVPLPHLRARRVGPRTATPRRSRPRSRRPRPARPASPTPARRSSPSSPTADARRPAGPVPAVALDAPRRRAEARWTPSSRAAARRRAPRAPCARARAR